MPLSTSIFFAVIYTLEAIMIIIGNTFTIFVFWNQRSGIKRTYFLLINLAIADLLVGITELTVLAAFKSEIMLESDVLLSQSPSNPSVAFQLLFSSTSVYFLALVSLERAFSVLWPIRHRSINSRVYTKSIVFVWAVGLCFFATNIIALYNTAVKWDYVFTTSVTSLFISQLIICTSYLKIRNRLRASSPGLDIHNHQLRAQNLRLSKTIFITIASSLVFWMPAFIILSTREFSPQCLSVPVVRFANAMYLANSMVNPLVYSFRMPIFKDALKKLCRKRQQNIGPGRASGHARIQFLYFDCQRPVAYSA